jgi:hypothetical protein
MLHILAQRAFQARFDGRIGRGFTRHWLLFAAITPAMNLARRCATLALLLTLVYDVQPVAASDLAVTWSAPSECPSESRLRERVMKLLGDAAHSGLRAVTRVTRRGDVFHAHILVRGPSGGGTGEFGERDLEDATCEQLFDSVAVLIALSVPSQSSVRQPPSLVMRASLEGRLLLGALPLPAAGAGGALALEVASSMRFELHGAYHVPQSSVLAGTALGARFELVTFGARACRVSRVGMLQLGPCLGAEFYYAAATAFGGKPSRSGSAIWWGPALALLSRLRISERVAVYIALEAVAPFARPRFNFSDAGDLHRVAAVAAQVVLAPEVHF